MAKQKIRIKKISQLSPADGAPVVLAEENNELKQFDLSKLNGLEGGSFSFNPIVEGEIDGDNCRFFVTRDMDINRACVFLNGVKLKMGTDYFHRPNKKELVFSFAPFLEASLEIYSN